MAHLILTMHVWGAFVIPRLIMAALRSRCGHYIFVIFLSFFHFLFLSSFYHRIISAVADWMSTIYTPAHGVVSVRI